MKNKLWKLLLAALVTMLLSNLVTSARGYRAIGGEVVLIPFIYLVKYIFIEMKNIIREF